MNFRPRASIWLDRALTLVSFNIINLYPSKNIPEITDSIDGLIEDKYGKNRISETLIKSSRLILNHAYFCFNNRIYQQKKGVPMGSCISGHIAELKLRMLVDYIPEETMKNIKLWVRYVDDIFAVISKEAKPLGILQTLNSLYNNIKFTMEIENNGCINYLDVKNIKNHSHIETTVFRKPTSSNEIINIACQTPYQYIIAALRSYINRAILICPNEQLLLEEINIIAEIGHKAGYH